MNPKKKSVSKSKSTKAKKLSVKVASPQPGFPIEITGDKRAEEALQESEEKFRNLFNNAEVGMFRTRLDGSEILDMNEKFLTIFGRTRAEMQGSASVLHWADPREREEMARRLEAEGHVIDFECGMLNKQGELRRCLTSIRLYREQGILEGSILDITERKQIEEKLEQDRILLRTLVDNLPDRIYVMDVQGRKIMSNLADWQASGGKKMEDVIGKTDFDTYPPELAKDYWAVGKAVIDTNTAIFNREEPGLDSRGNPVWVLSSKIPLRDGQGKVVGLVGIGHEITERKQAEETLTKTERIYRQAITRAGGVPYQLDYASESYVFLGEGFESLTGYLPSEMTGALFSTRLRQVESFGEHKDLSHEQLIRLARQGEVDEWREDLLFERKDGALVWLADQSVQIKDAAGKTIGALGILMDITERKRFESVQDAIYRITQAAITSEGIEALYHSIHSILGELIPTDNFFIALYDPLKGLISFPYYIDQYDEPPTGMTQVQGLTGYVIRTGCPLLATREIFDRLVGQGEVEAVGTAGVDWMGAPLKVEGRMIGVMAVQSYTQEIHFNQEDLNLLEFVSTQVAQAIERKRMEEEIRSLSLTDELTGLYNRRGFTLLAEQEVKLAHRKKRSMLLFFGDVDNLKTINDIHGHAQGDQALKEVSVLLKNSLREADIVARIGGDEFVGLALDASLESVETMTNRLQSALERRNQQGDRLYHLTLSLGISHYDPEVPSTVNELIARADALMYAQKRARKR